MWCYWCWARVELGIITQTLYSCDSPQPLWISLHPRWCTALCCCLVRLSSHTDKHCPPLPLTFSKRWLKLALSFIPFLWCQGRWWLGGRHCCQRRREERREGSSRGVGRRQALNLNKPETSTEKREVERLKYKLGEVRADSQWAFRHKMATMASPRWALQMGSGWSESAKQTC